MVRERNWLSFKSGEIRVCTSCHGLSQFDQAGQGEPTNAPLALRELLEFWRGGGLCPNAGCDDGGIDADFDGDCDVDLQDLATLLAQFGASGSLSADTDGDQDVDLSDLANVLSRFGNVCR